MRQCSIAKRILSVLLACLLLSGAVITPLAAAPQERGQDTPERVQTSSEDTTQTQTEPEDAAEAEEPYDPEPEPQADELESVQPQAATISDDDLFFKHPRYLDNDYIDEGYGKAEAACFAVLNSYSGSDEVIAACMQILKDGIISTAIMQGSNRIGITQSRYESCLDAATRSFLKQYLPSSIKDDLADIVSDVESKYKVVKDLYSFNTAVTKAKLVQDLTTKADLNGIHLSRAGVEKVADKIYGSKMISDLLDAAGYATHFAQIAVTMMELYSIEVEYLDFLLNELSAAGMENLDLYTGISTIRAAASDASTYIFDRYIYKDLVKLVIKSAKKLFNTMSSLVGLTETIASMLAKYVYEGATADDLITCYQHMGFCAALDTCITKYRTKFRNGKGTQDDKERYLALFTARNAAYVAALQQCSTASRIMDRFRLGGDCLVWASNLQSSYTVDNYLSWCKSAIQNDISNGTINSSGETIITDALNEQTIKERLEKLASLPAYKPNVGKQWSGKFDGVGRSLGFAAMVFNTVFDKIMSPRVDSRYQYKLTNEANVRKLGQLEEGSVTAEALKTLFADARIGDVVISSGKDDNCHAMILLSVNESGLTVYDCNSLFHGTYDTANIIQQYEFSYDAMAKSFNSHGSYSDMAGIAVYRAIRKISPKNSGSNIYYEEFDDSVNYVVEDGVLTAYNGACSKIEIPDGVTEIAAECFKNKTFIKYVYMPDTVTTIGSTCFFGCTSLQYVKFSNTLQSINSSAFYNCKLMGSVVLPDSVTYLDSHAFAYCSSLSRLVLSKSLEEMSYGCFQSCTKLTAVEIPASLNKSAGSDCYNAKGGPFTDCSGLKDVTFEEGCTEIVGYLFDHCTGLEEITIPETVTEIGSRSFMKCTALRGVIFNENLTRIEDSAFNGCSSLEEVTLPDSVAYLGSYAFVYCSSLSRLVLSKSLEEMSYGCFQSCTKLTAVEIPASLNKSAGSNCSSVRGGPFTDCSGLKSVTFEDGCTEIAEYLFDYCTGLEEITIPETVTKIGSGSFKKCTALRTVVFSENLTRIEDSAFNGCISLEEVTLPDSVTYLGSYAFVYCSSLSRLVLSKSLEEMSYGCFQSCTKLTAVEIPASLNKSAGSNCSSVRGGPFTDCSGLKSVTFEDGCTEIAEYLFDYCTGLEEITIPETVTKIGSGSFKNCTALRTVVFSENLTRIENSAFNGCSSLTEAALPDNITYFGTIIFANCSSLTTIVFPNGIQTIPDSTLYGCTALESVVLPDNVTKIGANAFRGCSALSSFEAGFELDSIGKNAFYECKNLTDVKLNQNLTSIGEYAFYGCAALKTIVIPDRVNTIGSHAFQKCAALTDVTLPHDLITLTEYIFANCTSLAAIVLPEGVASIQSYAFYQDTKFTAITIPASVTSISTTNVISYPTKTTITGYAGSAAESYAATKKAKFVALETPTAPLTLADGSTTLTIGRGVTMRPAFNRDDIVSLSSDNYKVQVKNGMWLYGRSTGSAVITAKTASGESFTFTAYSKPVASVSVTPAQISSSLGEDLNTSSLCVTAAFSDGTSCPVTYYTLSGYSSRTEGERSVTVRYGDKSCTLTVNVSQAPASGTLGDTLRWRFDPLQNTLTFSGALPQNAQILVASYESTGKLLETQLIQNENAAVSLRPGAAKIKCFLVNDAFIPLCRAANIQEL